MQTRKPICSSVFFGIIGLAVYALSLPASVGAAESLVTARSLLDQQQYAAAVAAADSYLGEHPGDTQARFIRGLALARSGQVDAAISVFEALAEEFPELAEPRNNLGVLYAQQKKFAQARDVLEQAVKISPEHAPAQENLGDVYVALARAAYANASELEPDNTAVRTKRTRLQGLLGRQPAGVGDAQSLASNEQNAAGPKESVATQPEAPAADSPLALVNAWAQAWSDQNLDAYFAAYSDHFDPEGPQSLDAWRRERRTRISQPSEIQVQISDLQIQSIGSDSASARFTQDYDSDGYSDRVGKRLELERGATGWRIVRETSD